MEGVKLGVEGGVDNKAALARMLNRGGMFMEESKGVCYWYGAAGVFFVIFYQRGLKPRKRLEERNKCVRFG